MSESAAQTFTSPLPTCDYPGCDARATGKVGFDWHCRAHRPGARPLTLAIAADVPVVLYGGPFHEPVTGLENVLLKPTKKRVVASTTVKPKPRKPQVYKVPRRQPGKAYNPTIKNPLPLVMRVDADEHPELCRIAGCVAKVCGRGLCDPHSRRAREAGLMEALALPTVWEAARLARLAAKGRR